VPIPLGEAYKMREMHYRLSSGEPVFSWNLRGGLYLAKKSAA
jgi:hypothetical protein